MHTEILPAVYDITVRNTGGRYRVFLLDGDAPTLVDAGFKDTVDAVAEAAADLDIDPERLAVTHGDPDHIGGFDGLVDEFDLETWVPEGLDLDADNDPNHRYGDGDDVGRFVAVHTPGHTASHHSLVDEDADVAVLGDTAFRLIRVASPHPPSTPPTSTPPTRASNASLISNSTPASSTTGRMCWLILRNSPLYRTRLAVLVGPSRPTGSSGRPSPSLRIASDFIECR